MAVVQSLKDTLSTVSFPTKRMRICIRHWSCSSIPRLFSVLAVCLILLSGYQIPGKYQGKSKHILNQTSYPKQTWKRFTKCNNLLLQRATAILLQNATNVISKWDKCYDNGTTVLLQSSANVTKRDDYYKVWQNGSSNGKLPINTTDIIISLQKGCIMVVNLNVQKRFKTDLRSFL